MSSYQIQNLEDYFLEYPKSVNEPETFWATIAKENFVWRKSWHTVLDWGFSVPKVSWFEGAQLNITENCLDRHLDKRGDKTAIIFEPNHPDEEASHCLLYTSPSPRDQRGSRMPSSA